MKSQSYRDLLVWQKSIELCIKVYEACRDFPRSET
jgi:23S rRNA-intervening sequence protein